MPELLERDHETGCVRRLVDAAASSAGGLLVIEGDAGIGKTGLVRAAATLAAERDVRVLGARGAELEQDLAFGMVRELLGAAASEPGTALEGAATLAGPVLGPVSAAGPGGQDLFGILHGLYWLVADLAAVRPLLLVVDDAHWCDVPSLRFLAYLARRLDGVAVGLLVATRPTAVGGRQDLLGVLAAEPGAVMVRPRPLTADGVRRLVTAALGPPDPAFCAACRTTTGGNPFLLGELLAELAAAGVTPRAADVDRVAAVVPRGVLRAVHTRLAALPGPAVALAAAAAVLGDGADPGRAARLAGIPDAEVVAAADALVAARLVERDTALTFLHPLLRSAVASTLGPARLAATHRRAATVLAADGEHGDALVPHLLAAPPAGDPWIVDALRAAARRATARGAPETAARYLIRALAEPVTPADRHGVLLALGQAEMQAGSAAAATHLAEAVEDAPDGVARARSSLLLARVLAHSGRFPEAVQVCERAVEALGEADADLTTELTVELLTAATQHGSTRPVALRWHAARAADPEPTTRAACMLLANLALEEVVRNGSRERALRLAELSLGGRHLLDPAAMMSLPSALISLTLAGRAGRAVQVWDEAIALHRLRGDVRGFALASAFRGYASHYCGDLDATIADTRCALDLVRAEAGPTVTEGFAVAWLVYALIDTGDHAGADAELAARASLFESGPWSTTNYLFSARGRLRVAQGRHDEAVADLEQCGRRAASIDADGPVMFRWRPHLALALFGRGEGDRASVVAKDAVDSARGWGAPLPLAESLRVAGLVTAGPEGVALLRQAVDVATDTPLERARALTALGAALRRSGRRVEARVPLRAGLDLALARGAGAVADLAHEELVAAGGRPRRLRATGVDALTATERRVATMVAGGLTNRAVAQALFVSEKTVETHLGHTDRKLGVTSRTQLGAALG
ncbi:helix-turn-helix transcriptional regulator [Pseudonocardia abyssalis]|uniref:AAA family ATPase n=2 Tax=Pseudonocardia abyssalis TaxID=2792008 RepID=A0ABS6UQG5_9PSEU|nr:LuxR family transcriptional regulator [Pseudonocardia abyssalis]MBW0134417.1 AAA family ATPase [Pseudonocardia abyssalis]